MSVSELSKKFLHVIEERVGPFDRPFQLRVFPFDAGGALNFLTVGTGRSDPFVTYVSWDLSGHEQQKHGSLGRYELLAICDAKEWCLDVLTKIGRQTLQEVFEPGDTLDIGQWVSPGSPMQGIMFEEALRGELRHFLRRERCGLLRCIGITRPELEFAMRYGTAVLVERLKQAGNYPRTIICRRQTMDRDPEKGAPD
jgi:hypothetical protein